MSRKRKEHWEFPVYYRVSKVSQQGRNYKVEISESFERPKDFLPKDWRTWQKYQHTAKGLSEWDIVRLARWAVQSIGGENGEPEVQG